ncbi:Hypothetical predicted protein [Cloeon dipterum]|uniref:Uncharacterized protein n=1 Tax=Cloeon dipterum TaxID=197152 RepID=A0A8S1BLX7_9INSE|nr:Hypothetical predicted protein [Cloeon dipterum]
MRRFEAGCRRCAKSLQQQQTTKTEINMPNETSCQNCPKTCQEKPGKDSQKCCCKCGGKGCCVCKRGGR